MGVCAPDIHKGERETPLTVLWAGLFSPAGLWEGVHAFKKVGFESQLWSWTGTRAEIWSLGPHFQDQGVLEGVKPRGRWHVGGFLIALL